MEASPTTAENFHPEFSDTCRKIPIFFIVFKGAFIYDIVWKLHLWRSKNFIRIGVPERGHVLYSLKFIGSTFMSLSCCFGILSTLLHHIHQNLFHKLLAQIFSRYSVIWSFTLQANLSTSTISISNFFFVSFRLFVYSVFTMSSSRNTPKIARTSDINKLLWSLFIGVF